MQIKHITQTKFFRFIRLVEQYFSEYRLKLKVTPQFCTVHPFCACFNNKSLRNIFKMAAILSQKDYSKEAPNRYLCKLRVGLSTRCSYVFKILLQIYDKVAEKSLKKSKSYSSLASYACFRI